MMKPRFVQYVLALLACLAAATPRVVAQPSLSSVETINGQKFYRDIKKANLYYYVPASYNLATASDGRPDLTLTKMRYTGTAAAGDAGVEKYNNLLQFRVSVDPESLRKINDAKTGFKKLHPSAELRPLPIRKFESLLVFAGSGATDTARLIPANYSEATDENAASSNSYWNERIVTLRLSNFDEQLVESALRNHQSVMSFAYAMFSVFSEADVNDVAVYGDNRIRKEIRDFFDNEVKNQADSTLPISLFKADVVNLSVDPDKWPATIQSVDINEKVPARYALFDVYCYDFNNDLRYDLYAKKIEIRATSVNGSDITTSFTFRQAQPDIYAKSIRFPYAVRFDRPFFYRVTEINQDGDINQAEWKQRKEWSQVLDITSAPDQVVHKPTIPEPEQ